MLQNPASQHSTKKPTKKKIYLLIFCIFILSVGLAIATFGKIEIQQDKSSPSGYDGKDAQVGMANPAAVYYKKLGYEYQIVNNLHTDQFATQTITTSEKGGDSSIKETQQQKTANQNAAQNTTQQPTTLIPDGTDGTFQYRNDLNICKQDGKPIIYLFSTSWCPHCQWIKDTFDKVVNEYVSQGKIVAYHWQLDTHDDTLTSAVETQVPAEALAVYNKFNPDGSIPTFVFGCKYWRIGNGYESQNDLAAEETEFRALIDKIIASDLHKFTIKNSSGTSVASLSDLGAIVLSGICTAQATCTPPDNSFIVQNSSGETVGYIDSSGNLCIETGDCTGGSANCNSPNGQAFLIQDSSGTTQIYIDQTGDLCLTGTLTQSGSP